MSARDEILTRVREAIAPASALAPHLAREYPTGTDDGVETFIARLHQYQRRRTAFPQASWARRLVPCFANVTRAGSGHLRAYRKPGWWA